MPDAIVVPAVVEDVIKELNDAADLITLHEAWQEFVNTEENIVCRQLVSLKYWNLRACFLIDMLSRQAQYQMLPLICDSIAALQQANLCAQSLQDNLSPWVELEVSGLVLRAHRVRNFLNAFGKSYPSHRQTTETLRPSLDRIIEAFPSSYYL